MILTGCLSTSPTLTPGPIETATPTPLPTPTATPMPLGSAENPLVLGLVVQDPGQQLDAPAAALATRLSNLTHLTVRARVFPDYLGLLDRMASDEVHIALLPPLTYLYASNRGLAEVALLTNHFGVYAYGSQFVANASSGFKIYYDPLSGQNSADASAALAQFEGKKPCWVDTGSASGFIVPAGLLALNKISLAPPAYSQTHAAVIRSLYVKGVCDFGATFAISGDPRTGDAVLKDLPDALTRIPIVWRSDAIIPNLNISYIAGLQEEKSRALNAAFLSLGASSQGRALISAAAGGYEIEALKSIEDASYEPLRAAVNALDLSLFELIGK